ncbi:peptidase inhibitor family I36 protein [Streptosporangium sp. NBC_01495]|uniref:peptidase inhibitor family I36 protein n=1 Tax=Streptosporangium sp. NBC_01495 TaxID=2903899 RepID=UPI002E2F058C|nr:peptidase inhibitor family I36 protein [Streptosporangium sp. NBC_01495]
MIDHIKITNTGRIYVTWTKKAATAASALLFAMGGMSVTASPAAADGPCPAKRLCIYDLINFEGNRIASGSTNACFEIDDFAFDREIRSYDNNLSVDAAVWHRSVYTGLWTKERTLVANKFSSDIARFNVGGTRNAQVCMGPSAYPSL